MITLIIPFYNAKETLLDVALNAVNQLFSGAELLLVDDGSNDQSSFFFSEIASASAKKGIYFNLITLQNNSGLLAARIAGAKAALFEYIGYLDSDDYIFEIDRAEVENIISKNFDVALYRFLYCSESLSVRDELIRPATLTKETLFKNNLMSWTCPLMGLYKKDVYLSVEHKLSLHYACIEEVYFKLIFSKTRKVLNSNIKYFYVDNPKSNSKFISIKRATKILAYHEFTEILIANRYDSEDIFLATTYVLNTAVEQIRQVSMSKNRTSQVVYKELIRNIYFVFIKQKFWGKCFNIFYPKISIKTFLN